MNTPFTSLYAHNRARSKHFGTENTEESMTQQDDAKDCDINVIVKRFTKNGSLPALVQQGLSGDFTQIGDYRSMVERIKAANDAFAEIPAEIRKRFGNDPDEFMKFVNDKNNLAEMRKMGLALPEQPPPAPPEPMLVKVVADPEPPK